MPTSRNTEDKVSCPVEGCDAEPMARGLYMHIFQTDEKGHGPRKTFPDHIDKEEIRVTDQELLEIDYPDSVDLDDTKFLNPFDGQVYEGKRGLMIHLGQKKGQGSIPEDITEKFDAVDFPIVQTDDDGNIIEVISEGSPKLPPIDVHLPWVDYDEYSISRSRVENFVEELKEGSGAATAETIEERLLD